MPFKRGTIRSLRRFRHLKVWRGTLDEKNRKIKLLHTALCHVYGKDIRLSFHNEETGSGMSNFRTSRRLGRTGYITLHGRHSVVTYLHEFAHALGYQTQESARWWSLKLYRRIFRVSARNYTLIEGMMVRNETH